MCDPILASLSLDQSMLVALDDHSPPMTPRELGRKIGQGVGVLLVVLLILFVIRRRSA